MKKSSLLIGTLFLAIFAVTTPACDEETVLRERAKIQAHYDDAIARGDGTEAAYWHDLLDKADAELKSIHDDPVPTTIDTATRSPLVNLIPTPIREPLVLGAGLVAALWRMFRYKRAGVNLAKSIEKLPESTTWSSDNTTLILDANQSPAAKTLVDLAQGKKVPLLDRIL